MSEKYKISLGMEGTYSSTDEFRILREKRSKESSNSSTDFSIKIIQN